MTEEHGPVPQCPQWISHYVTRNWIWYYTLKSQIPTAWTMAQPGLCLMYTVWTGYKLKQSPNLIWYLVQGQTQRPRPHRFLVHVDKYILISVQLIMLLGCTPVVW